VIINNDNIQALKELEDNSIDSVVTDPPYGLSFMGKKWDYDVPSKELWLEVFRVLKPGGHLLSFGGSRTYHRLAVGIEDAGFEIRDQIMWVYGSGFPKSHNIGKAVDKLQGNEREVIGTEEIDIGMQSGSMHSGRRTEVVTRDKTKGNSKWEGWGTALKPAHEPIVLARKPLSEKTVAKNVLKWGTGGINIDDSRVGNEERTVPIHSDDKKDDTTIFGLHPTIQHERVATTEGRFPANFIHDGSDEVVDMFPDSKSNWKNKDIHKGDLGISNNFGASGITGNHYDDSGSASRFFYCAKASKSERNAGLDGFEKRFTKTMNDGIGGREHNEKQPTAYNSNHHPTVKPIALMRYLARLITPKQGTVLDPFMGSGTTGIACKLEGFNFVGIEIDPEYFKIAEARIKNYKE
jgi:site-specific DNA-methyltransferase (adenine-specific)